MRHILFASILLLWWVPSASVQGQWYGWDNHCQATSDVETGDPMEICGSVQVSTVSPYPGTTLVLARAKNLSPVYWGGPIGAIFSLPGAENPEGFSMWYDSSWNGHPDPWLLPFYHQPSFGGGWDYYSLETPVEVKETDLVGFFGEAYGIEDYETGEFATYSMTFTDPGYIVPEPTSFFLIGTGLLGIALLAWRRRDSEAT